jgi:glycosyltransferase involved in cell wall biosynthesis
MHVLYVFGSFPDEKHTFINREIEALRSSGISISYLVINPYSVETADKSYTTFSASKNPFSLITRPFINLIKYKKSILFSKSFFEILKASDSNKVGKIRVLTGLFFIESALGKVLKSKTQIDQIHVHHLFSAALYLKGLSEKLNTDYSLTIHTLSHYFKVEALKQTLQNARFLRTVTTETQTYFNRLLQNKQVHFIPNCVDVGNLPKRNSDSKDLHILAIGYFLDKKGFDVLIKSCKLVQHRFPEFKCTIIGEGPEQQHLEKLISDYQLKRHIQLVPYQSFNNLLPYFMNATLLAVPSRDPLRSTRDGLPTVILEAMAIGLPVVASNFAGIPDAIINEETGLLVEPENTEQLAGAIIRIKENNDLAQKLTSNSLHKAETDFSIKINIEKLNALFHDKNFVTNTSKTSNL